jgi:hypothetical protein
MCTNLCTFYVSILHNTEISLFDMFYYTVSRILIAGPSGS